MSDCVGCGDEIDQAQDAHATVTVVFHNMADPPLGVAVCEDCHEELLRDLLDADTETTLDELLNEARADADQMEDDQ